MDARVTEFAVGDAKARFSELLARAEAGDEITIKRHGTAIAKLVPMRPKLSVGDRRARREAYLAWNEEHGPMLGPDLTIRQLIDEGRR